MKQLFLALLFFEVSALNAQEIYRYSVDLNRVQNDALTVELMTPRVRTSTVVFSFPKIIPGTYAIADYGKFISGVKAWDGNGKSLSVTRLNDNQWRITGSQGLKKISYQVDDIYDAEKKHTIYPMAATNFEEGRNFVLNTPGIFGYLEGLRALTFHITIKKPVSLYASTSFPSKISEAGKDEFEAGSLDELYDYPIMYSVPDTASVKVGNCQVLVSVYSPNAQIHAREIIDGLRDLLEAARRYLGGRLPADKYAFIYYFRDPKTRHSFPPGLGGALEHTTSSFYYFREAPAAALKDNIVDVSSHEFFHIITPLTIASREVKEFNFDKAVLSRHLWLYEGVTEYTAHHVQVRYGLNTVQQFLDKLSSKITNSRSRYRDDLPFTELSREAAGKWAEEYANVYEKGALIAACLDIYLLHLSKGSYGLRQLTYDLGVRFGKKRYFNDAELFDEIADLTYPEIKDFLVKYVAGPTPIPYEYFFGLAGIQFRPTSERQAFTFGNISMGPNEKGVVSILPPFRPNEFGRKLGYREGDELYAFNNKPVTPANLDEVITAVRQGMKEGEPFTVRIGRQNNGQIDTILLSAPAEKVTITDINKLTVMPSPDAAQLQVRRSWLMPGKSSEPRMTPPADPADVSSIDAVIKATYSVLSGPAGPRNWNRFFSLFHPDAQMGAISGSTAAPVFRSSTPESYQSSNKPYFQRSGFYEDELNRKVLQFGNVATVQSSYQFRFLPQGPVIQRGVNYFTLVRSNGRWWIINLTWQDEGKDLPLPKELER